MHYYSRHRRTASVVYVTTLTYSLTNDQWARPACPLVSSQKLNRVSSVQLPCFSLSSLDAKTDNKIVKLNRCCLFIIIIIVCELQDFSPHVYLDVRGLLSA